MKTDPYAWKRGMRLVRSGVYEDAQGKTHIDSAEWLEAHGFALTKENEVALYLGIQSVFKLTESIDEAQEIPE